MNTNISKSIILCFVFFMLSSALIAREPITPVEKYGQLRIEGSQIIGENNQVVQLAGMSFFWSQWIGKYYNASCVDWLVTDWKCSVVRAAMAVAPGGYSTKPAREQRKVEKVVDAAIKQGIYVVIDFHEHSAENFVEEAKTFFSAMAQKYGSYPNVIYEIYNEPLKVSWSKVVKPYCEEVIKTIRQYDPDNIIVCGTPNWSQSVDDAALDPIEGSNIAYALHFYAGTHKEWLIEKADKAIEKGLCLFVTEYGTTEANGDGAVYEKEIRMWYDWMDKNHISHCNWSIADKKESSAVLVPGASRKGGWSEKQIKPSGKLVRAELLKKHMEMFK